MARAQLPIFELEQSITSKLRSCARLVLQAPTGSGKSTKVPQFLLDHGLAGEGQIVVLQPRRLATRMVAARVAQERGVKLGDEVGYQIRLDNVTSPATRVRFVTEGILLRQMMADRQLRGVSVIVFDEFHERHLHGDITLARALDLQAESRPDLRLVVMSATLETAQLERYLEPCEVVTATGRTFAVEKRYKRVGSDEPVWEAAARAFDESGDEGDALVFMPGTYEIHRTIEAIKATRSGRGCDVLPLHGELSPAAQDAAVGPSSRRKVIVSTNVAETSLTIDGVRVVIDSGLARIARFDPYRGINTLLVEKISRASADQRAGRAGRTAPGICIRLWTELDHAARAAQELPEVRRLDLSEVVLALKGVGVADVRAFRWLEPPEPRALERAERLLEDLGAVEHCEITPVGKRMGLFPVHPRYARMLLAAEELGCVPEAALLAALTQGRPLLLRTNDRKIEEERERLLGPAGGSDFMLMLKAWEYARVQRFDVEACRRLAIHAVAAREAAALREQFLAIAAKAGVRGESDAPADVAQVSQCVLAGFPDQVAVRLDAGTLRCAMVHGRRGVLARESAADGAKLLVTAEVREISGKGGELQTLLTLATPVEEEWLRQLFPRAWQEGVEVLWDPAQRRVVARRETRFHDLVLRTAMSDDVPPTASAEVLAREIMAGSLPLPQWDHAVDQWLLRVNQVAGWFPELELPMFTAEEKLGLLEQVCYGARSFREIKERPVWPTVRAWLSPQQAAMVEELAPERITLPNGKKMKIVYNAAAAPVVAARIQDLYGVMESLRIASGRVQLVIQVLAPNHRPIQVTQNLTTFWKESYPKIKLELARKYPKHEWR